MTRLLLVSAESAARELLAYNLTRNGYDVVTASDGDNATRLAQATPPDLILLDRSESTSDAAMAYRTLCQAAAAPIVLLTTPVEDGEALTALDNFIVKPVAWDELTTRLRAVLDRHRRAPPLTTLRAGDLLLDLKAQYAMCAGHLLNLTPKEFNLLAAFMQNRGAVLTRAWLLQHVWKGKPREDRRTLDVHISWLRKKIGDDAHGPHRIKTIRTIGYRFEG